MCASVAACAVQRRQAQGVRRQVRVANVRKKNEGCRSPDSASKPGFLLVVRSDRKSRVVKQRSSKVLRRFVVEKDERALLTRNGEFVEVLRSGSYWFFDPLRRL